MRSLYDFNYEQIQEFALEKGWKKFRGHQFFKGSIAIGSQTLKK